VCAGAGIKFEGKTVIGGFGNGGLASLSANSTGYQRVFLGKLFIEKSVA